MQDLRLSRALDILEASRLGTLCLAKGDEAYGFPVYFAYDGDAVYFHCHPGMKDAYLDATATACLLVSHVHSQDVWESIQVFGEVERLSLSTDLQAADAALYKIPFPPADGNYPGGLPRRPEQETTKLRIRPTRVAGKASAFQEAPDA